MKRKLKGQLGPVSVRVIAGHLYLYFAGIKIAERGLPNTPQAKTWISEPGWSVMKLGEGFTIKRLSH